MTLGRFSEERIFRPMKMEDSGFHVPSQKHARIAQPPVQGLEFVTARQVLL